MTDLPQSAALDQPWLHDADAVARGLGADAEHGLSPQVAAQRLARHGPNQLRAAASQPAWRLVLAQFQDPLVYLLLGAIGIALAAWLIEGRQGWPVDGIVIAMVVMLNAVLGFAQETRAASAVAALARLAEQLHPLRPLARGYVRVTTAAGATITTRAAAAGETALALQFADGTLAVTPAAANPPPPSNPAPPPNLPRPRARPAGTAARQDDLFR